MNNDDLNQLLKSVAEGRLSVKNAAGKLRHIAYEDIEYAHVDHHRSLRKGFPEVIFGQGKTADQVIGIMEKMKDQENVILATRLKQNKADAILSRFPDAVYHPDAKMIVWTFKKPRIVGRGTITIITAGTSDIPVAKEAYLTAKAMGNRAETIFDVGVSGIHRLFSHKDIIEKASVLIVIAGMEGALPSVVAGMVSRPVIAVPTSVGYGVSLGGLAALFAMLNSCSSNVAVVNIDNGFGAGYMASIINRK
ncbi:MAG: nickel pincer cofactor biosynthesis protein LarB [Desulfobacterales bacterium]|jgi:NCAIR mutase (PurE)-related protein|nr:nickel pincer cofactor biosynthesis protein LarB [Desulfobacterales bacterium]